MNSICLTGRLSADVELKQTQSGVSVCSFTLAVNRPNVKDTTDWINCVAWRNTAEFITRYFKKGNMIAITGVLTSRKYQDNNGNKRTAFEVVVDRAEFCESKGNDTTDPKFTEQPTPNIEDLAKDDDLPF